MARKPRKSMTGAVQGMDAFFTSTAAEEQDTQDTTSEEELERVTLYIRPDQDSLLTELQSKLKRRRVKTNRSELVRAAIDILSERELDTIEQLLQEDQKR